jgi:hypothetical protein
MSDEDLILSTDDAHITALELSTHILEYANAFRLISSQNVFLGQRRIRYGILLLMMDEMGKLMEIMKDCERAVTMKDPFVKVEKFFSKDSGNEKALTDILKEIGKSETLIILFQRVMGRSPSKVDFEKFKMQFTQGSSEIEEKIRTNLYYDIRDRTDHADMIPEDQVHGVPQRMGASEGIGRLVQAETYQGPFGERVDQIMDQGEPGQRSEEFPGVRAWSTSSKGSRSTSMRNASVAAWKGTAYTRSTDFQIIMVHRRCPAPNRRTAERVISASMCFVSRRLHQIIAGRSPRTPPSPMTRSNARTGPRLRRSY